MDLCGLTGPVWKPCDLHGSEGPKVRGFESFPLRQPGQPAGLGQLGGRFAEGSGGSFALGMSVYRLVDTLPDLRTVRDLSRSMAMLDAVLCREWDYRYYSFD